mgnify:CR=1 FL=1
MKENNIEELTKAMNDFLDVFIKIVKANKNEKRL